MMQSRRREHGSSGELDVFGATSYFAGVPPAPDDDCRRPSSATEASSADRVHLQAKVVQRDTTGTTTTEDNSFRGPHQQQQQLAEVRGSGHATTTNKQMLQVVAANKRQQAYSGKSKLAALLSFMVSPSPRASFRKEINKEAPSTIRLRQAEAAAAGGGGEREPVDTYQANSPSSSSRKSSGMQLQGLSGAHDDDDDDELDLGVATGDRRLHGITVVRGIGGGEERWVVRCVPGPGAWDDGDEEHREKMLDVDAAESASNEQNIKGELVEVEQGQGDDDDGNIGPAHSSWDSDSSSDLFDLDLEY